VFCYLVTPIYIDTSEQEHFMASIASVDSFIADTFCTDPT